MTTVDWLFSYGTLRQPEVQLGVFGRLLHAERDVLPGFRLDWVAITDPEVVALSGSARHPILVRTDDERDRIPGLALQVGPDDLVAADDYEVDDYHRVAVRLESGREAWVYVGP